MPHEVLKLVMAHLEQVNDDVVVAAWVFVAQWCLMAAQRDASGDSWVAYLSRWVEQCLSSTLGVRPTIGSPAASEIALCPLLP
jgi:hypothetical protein